MASTAAFDTHFVEAKVKTLVNAQLKYILKDEGLPVSGVKAAMQDRIIAQLQSHARAGDLAKFNDLKSLVSQLENHQSPSLSRAQQEPPRSSPSQHQYLQSNSTTRPAPAFTPPQASSSFGSSNARPIFKDSPFYTIIQHLTPVLECKVREATRDHVDSKIILRPDIADRLAADQTMRIMVYCASDPVSHFSKVDIAFPHQVEIKVNLDEVKANLRGLKNKPGSTRPADITDLLRKRAHYENSLTVTYALTHKKFYVIVNLVRRHSVEELVARLKSGRTISRDRVIQEMISKAQDSDVQATSSKMSLKCPLSTMRIDVPCRSTVCTHNQCFDALSFLQLQEQAPTWTCPVCSKVVNFEALEVDEYFDDILKSTPKNVDQVAVEPDGKWSRISDSEGPPSPGASELAVNEDDELVEIKDIPRLAEVRGIAVATHSASPIMRTPPASSREASTPSAVGPSTGNKRSIGQVVDLTISSDEEEERPRSPKRSLLHPPQGTSSATGYPSLAHASPRMNGANAESLGSLQLNPVSRSNYLSRNSSDMA